jgi:hypothetical protein
MRGLSQTVWITVLLWRRRIEAVSAPSTQGRLAASLADRVIAATAEARSDAHALADLCRLCGQSGIDAEVLLAEARRRAGVRDALVKEYAGAAGDRAYPPAYLEDVRRGWA